MIQANRHGVNRMANKSFFTRLAGAIAHATGSAAAFILACSVILIWAITGPIFAYSDTWQLIINTGTTIITFLMVFLIQNTQNRDAKAVQVKLDELLRATEGAHLGLMDLEDMEEAELRAIHDKYLAIAQEAHSRLKNGGDDCDTPIIKLD